MLWFCCMATAGGGAQGAVVTVVGVSSPCAGSEGGVSRWGGVWSIY